MQTGKLIARSLSQDFDAAIMIVANPSGDAEDVRLTFDKPTKAYALHASADEVTFGFDRLF